MASPLLGSPLNYSTKALTNTLTQSARVPKRRDCVRFRSAVAKTTTSDQIVVRRSGDYQPSVWSLDYVSSLENKYAKDNEVRERTNILKEEIRKMLVEAEGSLEQLEFIDALQRLGLSHHFEDEIDTILSKFDHENVTSCGKIPKMEDLHATALEFRLLRQHGFNVPQDVFDHFKNHESRKFKTSLNEDVKGLLSLYEASYLSTRLDTKLKEARTFATDCLRKFITKSIQTDKKESYMREIVIHAMEMPYHWTVSRLEARWYIDVYERRHDMNPILLEFAKLDFNIIQAVHQEELKHVFRWWNNTGLATRLDFARDRITESYLWTIILFYEPQFGCHRQLMTKVNKFITIIDDFYDIYGTPEELDLFTTAIEKWDVNHLEKIPENMRLCFLVLYNEINQNGGDVIRDKRFNAIPYLKKAWADLLKTWLTEAEWYNSGRKPSLREHMENACISSSFPAMLVHAYCVVSDQISKPTLDALTSTSHMSPLARCIGTIARLANDLATSSEEMARGDVPTSIQCYMHETGASEADARAHVIQMISDTWDELNYQIQTARSSSLSRRFVKTAANVARMAQCIYQFGDGHSRPDKAKTVDRVLSLLVRPIPPH